MIALELPTRYEAREYELRLGWRSRLKLLWCGILIVVRT